MKLYTLVVEYDHGTYITQANANSTQTAPSACIERWDICDLTDIITEQDKSIILEQLKAEQLIALSHTLNVWYGSVNLNNKPLTFNLILTDKDQ